MNQLTCAVWLLIALLPAVSLAAERPLNVILILADDK